MGVLNFFTRQRVKTAKAGAAPFAHVKGESFDPGAELFAFESTHSDPITSNQTDSSYRFVPLEVYQPPLVWQSLAVPPVAAQGNPFLPIDGQELITPSGYPDIQGAYYQ